MSGQLVRVTLCIPADPQDIATREQIVDGLLDAINSCGRHRLWLPQGTRVEGVELAAQELTEVQP